MSFGETPKPNPIPHEPFVPEAKEPKNSAELTPDDILQILLEVEAKTAKDPEAELTQLEASLLYQVDKDLPMFATRPDKDIKASVHGLAHYLKALRGCKESMSDDEIRQLPDYDQVKSLVKERLTSEKNIVDTSRALGKIMEGLGVEGYTPAAYMNTLNGYEDEEGNLVKGKILDWEERGVIDYLTIELIQNNNRHNIVPVPNQEFEAEQLFKLAHKFEEGERQLRVEVIDEELGGSYFGKYSSAELSGSANPEEGPLRLYLVPTQRTVAEATFIEQRQSLSELQQENPSLNLECPPVMVALALWLVLKQAGYDLARGEGADQTRIEFFNLDPIFTDEDQIRRSPYAAIMPYGLAALWFFIDEVDIKAAPRVSVR